MLEWITANGANLIIGALVLAVIALAGRHVYQTSKSGGCSGCSHDCGSGCCEPKSELGAATEPDGGHDKGTGEVGR